MRLWINCCYPICNNVYSALQKGRMDNKGTARSTTGCGQCNPITNTWAQLLVDNCWVTSDWFLACWTCDLTRVWKLLVIIDILILVICFLLSCLFLADHTRSTSVLPATLVYAPLGTLLPNDIHLMCVLLSSPFQHPVSCGIFVQLQSHPPHVGVKAHLLLSI